MSEETNLKVLRDALELLRDYIEECGGCDHSVGLCGCLDRQLLGAATAVLDRWAQSSERDPLGEALNSGDGVYRP